MRKISVAFRAVALVAVFSVSAIGQTSPGVLLYPATSIDLPVEPAHTQGELTLADAARNNNYPLFDALFTEAGEDAPSFAELHRFWKWSLTDPVGAFYGEEMHAKFAREYPGYAQYIAEYGIVDWHGNLFYPSAETRTFLLQQAMNTREPVSRVAAVPAPGGAKRVRVSHVTAPAKAAPVSIVAAAPKPAPASSVAAAAPAAVVARSARRYAETAAPPIPVRRTEGRSEVGTTPADNRFARGLALIIAGLVGVGLLTLMLRTPSEEKPERKEEAPMEPLRIIPLERKPKKTA